MGKTVIESCYFHWGNGGLTLEVEEDEYTSKGTHGLVEGGTVYTSYELKVGFDHHGAAFNFSMPLGSMEIVGWLHKVTGRLLKRMEAKNDQARNNAFDHVLDGRLYIEDGQDVSPQVFRWLDGDMVRRVPDLPTCIGQPST